MFRNIILIFLIILVCQALQPPSAHAQNANPCYAYSTWWFSDPVPYGWFVAGGSSASGVGYPGTFVYLIQALSAQCSTGPIGPCPGCSNQGGGSSPSGPPSAPSSSTPEVNQPIYLATGETYVEDTDIDLPGLGGGLHLWRRWQSTDMGAPQPIGTLGVTNIFGNGWRSTFEERLYADGSCKCLRYARSDGSVWTFGVGNLGQFVTASPARAGAIITSATIGGQVVLTFPNGEQRIFDQASSLLLTIVDRNGNQISIAYDQNNSLRPSTITDAASRHIYFNYQPGSNLVATITSDFGVSLSYSYNSVQQLTQVTKPDLTTINYSYDTLGRLAQVTDANGRVIETHTYDSLNRGLTASQANAVNAVTVTYPQ